MYAFGACLFANFLASHVSYALRLYNALLIGSTNNTTKGAGTNGDGGRQTFQMLDKRVVALPPDMAHTY